MSSIILGQKVKDKITGFEGIATSHVKYLTGCDQYGVTPQIKDGKIECTEYFDYRRLEVTGEGIAMEEVTEQNNPGGPNRECPKK